MDFSFDDAELTFRDEVRAFLASRVLAPFQFFSGRGGSNRELYTALGDRGWLSLAWPVEHGGAGLPITYDYLLWDQLAYYRAARPDLGPGVIAHAVIQHGSPAQRQHWLPALATGQVCFALGYSEPEAGSDLSGLRTRAELDGDVYRITGEKCWTSDAHHADYLWLLCRTGAADSRARGLTLLIVPMDAAGITVTPIETIDGHRLNSVFLDDVAVDRSHRIGDENGAWQIMRESLAVERHLQLLPGRLRRDYEDAVAMLGSTPEAFRTLDELGARVEQVEASSMATVAALLRGRSGIAEAARSKVLGGRLAQDIPRAIVDLAGIRALDVHQPAAFLWRQSFMETIAGGSVEIMLTILAREQQNLDPTR